MAKIDDFSTEPRFTIKTVNQRTGILPVTLRAWERRYHLLQPDRGENRYRLYSERDVAILQWIKSQLDSGISISNAVNNLKSQIKQNNWPEAVIPLAAFNRVRQSTQPPVKVAEQLFQAFIQHDEATASKILAACLAEYDLPTIFESVITPCLVRIGDGWFRGEIHVATEHFASNIIRAKLLSIFQNLPNKHTSVLIMVGGSPGELHEIGPLMIAVLLRNIGFKVEYLGPDLPLDDLAIYAKEAKPKMIILSATLEDSARQMAGFQKMLQKVHPQPKFGFGGGAFIRNPRLIEQVSGHYLGNSLTESVETVQKILLATK